MTDKTPTTTDGIHVRAKAPRATHTPAERATEAVNVLQRRLGKLTTSKAALELQALELEPQIEAMQKRLDYALSNPDLPPSEQEDAEEPETKQFEEAPAGTRWVGKDR